MHLRLVVNNTDDLSGGYSAIKDFNENGGTIGAAETSTWQLVDRDGSISGTHIIIKFIDNQFCFETLINKGLSVNGAKSFIPIGEPVQITDGDTIRIGKFELTAFIEMSIGEAEALESRGERWAKRFTSIGTLVDHEQEENITAQNFFQSKTMQRSGKINIREGMKRAQVVDPINLIEETFESRSTNEVDPVKLFDRDSQAERNIMASKLGDIINVEPEEAGQTEIPDDLQPGSAYMDMPKVKGAKIKSMTSQHKIKNKRSSDNELDSYLENLANSSRPASDIKNTDVRDVITRDRYLDNVSMDEDEDAELIDHVLLRPLCIALGLPIQKMSVPKANRLMTDVGEALRAAVFGLMEAQQTELSDKSHLAETHLHAIEDNPLRLNKNVDEVIEDLFLVKSPVHLSASSAITESLELIQYHERAGEIAADEALDAVLRALGPVALAKRFKKYKGHAPRAGDLDAWHWEMYQYYYREMRSEKQGGLGRMFWEVYRQVYDREMREQSMED